MRIHEIRGLFERALDPFVHVSVGADGVAAARHRAFIAAHLGSGLLALGLIPLCLAVRGSAAGVTAAALAILGLEVLVALWVSRTGKLDRGHLGSSAVLVALVAWVSANTGGLASFALGWFAIAPIEAALSGRRRIVHGAVATAAGGLVTVAALGAAGLLPPPIQLAGGSVAVNTVAGIVALGYAAGVALRVEGRNREVEERLRSREERYRLLAASISDVVVCHAADGSVSFVSPACERLAGVPPVEFLGERLFRRVHVADRPAYLSAVSTALHQGDAMVEFRIRRGDEDEPEAWVWVEAFLRRSETAQVCGGIVVSVLRDIDRRKLQQDELDRARQDAEAANFAKTRFLANVSHELRTPLNAIIGFSDMLVQGIFGKLQNERQAEYARLIKDSGEHLLQVVNDILDMSKIEAGSFDVTPEPFDLPALVVRCGQIMAPQAERAAVTIRTDLDGEVAELCADRRALRQILLNLLSNAIKFSNPGGEVVCGARRDGRKVAVFVRDNGIGIASDDLPRLGTPFVQGESGYGRRAEGTGLGLSVVKGLVALHGGSMTIESQLGVGTSVTVLLPMSPERDAGSLPRRSDRTVDLTPRLAKRA